MAELEKIKQARQSTMNLANKVAPMKDTLKPRNVTLDTSNLFAVNSLEEKIKMSRYLFLTFFLVLNFRCLFLEDKCYDDDGESIFSFSLSYGKKMEKDFDHISSCFC